MIKRVISWLTTPQSSPLIDKRNFQLVQLDAFGVGLATGAHAFLAIFLTRLGATNFQISLLSSMPALAGMAFVMVMGWFIQRRKNAAPWYSISRSLGLMSFLLTGLVPFFFSGQDKVTAVLVVWAIATIPQTIVNLTFSIVMNGMAGPDGRYEFMTHRWTILGITGAISTFIVGQILTSTSGFFPFNYQYVFIALSIGGFISFAASRNFIIPDNPPPPKSDGVPLLKKFITTIQLIRKQSGFFSFVAKRFVFTFGMTLSGPLMPIYFVRNAKMEDGWIAAISTAASFLIIFSYFIWTKQVHKRGARFALLWTTFGLSLYPILVSFTIEPWLIVIYAAVAGLFQGGLDLIFFDELMKTVPTESAATFISFYQTTNYMSSILAPLLATLLADSIGVGWGILIAGLIRLTGFGLFLIKPKAQAAT